MTIRKATHQVQHHQRQRHQPLHPLRHLPDQAHVNCIRGAIPATSFNHLFAPNLKYLHYFCSLDKKTTQTT